MTAPQPRRERRDIVSYVVAAIVTLFACVSLFAVVPTDRPLSIVDEHVHLDYALHIHDGTLPFRGSIYSQEVVDEWACGVGHEGGDLAVDCEDDPTPEDLPSGIYSTAYIHYPTYFLGAEAFRTVLQAVAPGVGTLEAYRSFSALCMSLGILALGFGAMLFKQRRSRMLALLTVPVAASSILFLGVIVNPGSTALLSGALIAIAGVRWMQTGRGFGWLLAATIAASITAVTNVLPAGAFMLVILAAIIARRFGWIAGTEWRPRWMHLLGLIASVLIPIIVWGRYIAWTATIDNEVLYSFAKPAGVVATVAGLISEITTLHSPWTENERLLTPDMGPVAQALRIPPAGLAVWITVMVFGALIYLAVRKLLVARSELVAPGQIEPERSRTYDVLLLLIAGAVLTIVLYPPALRLSNVLTFGFDFPITNRYSVAFAPLLVLLVLLCTQNRAFVRILAGVGAVALVGLSVSWL